MPFGSAANSFTCFCPVFHLTSCKIGKPISYMLLFQSKLSFPQVIPRVKFFFHIASFRLHYLLICCASTVSSYGSLTFYALIGTPVQSWDLAQ